MSSAGNQWKRAALLMGLAALPALSACSTPAATGGTRSTPTRAPGVAQGALATPPSAPPSATPGPARYTLVTVARGLNQPDDLALDAQGRLLFADIGSGRVERVEPSGQITILAQGLSEPEGIIPEADGSLLVAVQGSNGEGIDEIVRVPAGAGAPSVFVRFGNATGNPGLDGISLDPRTREILAADSPNGRVYRVSADGRQVTLVARGFVRPTDAIGDEAGNIYVADEYGNRVALVAQDGTVTTLATLSLPDDLAFDVDGTLLVTQLGGSMLLRLDPRSGRVLGTVAGGLHEPQGLVVDRAGDIFVAEQLVNVVVELRRE
jgi:serine/threonine protein kinase, bacterial